MATLTPAGFQHQHAAQSRPEPLLHALSPALSPAQTTPGAMAGPQPSTDNTLADQPWLRLAHSSSSYHQLPWLTLTPCGDHTRYSSQNMLPTAVGAVTVTIDGQTIPLVVHAL